MQFLFFSVLFLSLLLLANAACPNFCGAATNVFDPCRSALLKSTCVIDECSQKGKWVCKDRPLPLPKTCANVYGDPHITTFDRLSYDCQPKGEYTLTVVKKKVSFNVQARFRQVDTRDPTVMSAWVIQHKKVPRFQMNIVNPTEIPGTMKPTMINGCPVVFHIKKKYKELMMGSVEVGTATAVVSDDAVTLDFASGISIRAEVSPQHGCFISRFTFCAPTDLITIGRFRGMLGTPNRDPLDDWMNSKGKLIPIPADIRSAENSYCSKNWCVKKRSLFKYFETGSSHAAHGGCGGDEPPTDIDVSMAPDNIKDLCGIDYTCLVDGIMGGEEGAQLALDIKQAIDDEADKLTKFKCDPNNILANTVATIKLTMDVKDTPPFYLTDLDGFVAKQINPTTGMEDGVVVELLDNGSSENGDAVAGDMTFSGELAYASTVAGETISFKVIPIMKGEETPTSALTTIVYSAIRSFSQASGLGAEQGPLTTVVVPSLDGLELKTTYSWTTGQVDLDTNTMFLGDQGGFGCFGYKKKAEKIVKFLGDEEKEAGKERCMVKLDESKKMGLWSNKSTVNFMAGWHKVSPNVATLNPVTLTVTLMESATGKEVPNTRMSTAIAPGVQKECAERVVATMDVEITDEKAILTLKRSN